MRRTLVLWLISLALGLAGASTLREDEAAVRSARLAKPSSCSAGTCDVTGGGSYYDGLDDAWSRMGKASEVSFWYETTHEGAWFLRCGHCGCGEPIDLVADSDYGALSFVLADSARVFHPSTVWQDRSKDCATDPDPDCVVMSSPYSRPNLRVCGPYVLDDGTFPPVIDRYPSREALPDAGGETVAVFGQIWENNPEVYRYSECDGSSSSPACCLDRDDTPPVWDLGACIGQGLTLYQGGHRLDFADGDGACEVVRRAPVWATTQAKFGGSDAGNAWGCCDYPVEWPSERWQWQFDQAETWEADADLRPTRAQPPSCPGGVVYGFDSNSNQFFPFLGGCVDVEGDSAYATDIPWYLGPVCQGESTSYAFINDPGPDGRWPIVYAGGSAGEHFGYFAPSMDEGLNRRSIVSGMGGVQ